MKTDYKNWVPKGMVVTFLIASAVLLPLCLLFAFGCFGVTETLRKVLTGVFALAFLICAASSIWCVRAYNAFSYTGKRQLSRQIIDGIADHVALPAGGKGLDVGCGSGALTIACAKRNPKAEMLGIDRWGKDYASFNKPLCEANAQAEGVKNVNFKQGNALKLDFADESFDAVVSNYVYHNITGANKQELLMETLRVLKKGGVFAIHDLMGKTRYGDMKAFAEKLKTQDYEQVELIDTADGLFMSRKEANHLKLFGSTLLVGKK